MVPYRELLKKLAEAETKGAERGSIRAERGCKHSFSSIILRQSELNIFTSNTCTRRRSTLMKFADDIKLGRAAECLTGRTQGADY